MYSPFYQLPLGGGAVTNNGLLTCNNTSEASITNPGETIYSGLRAQRWDLATGTAPLPLTAPPADDPFWVSEFFDFGIDPYEKSDPSSPYWWSQGRIFPPCSLFPRDPYCQDWESLLDTHRYAGQAPYAFVDGHVKVMPFAATYKSPTDNEWDLH